MSEKINRLVAVFAHNESEKIISCLDSLKIAISEGDRCVVLNNGSSDNTAELVKEFSKKNDFCQIIEIKMGDKSNAWNIFVHDLNLDAVHYFFLDGDCEVLPNSLTALENCLNSNPEINAAAAVPATAVGKKDRQKLLTEGGLCGNFYALSGHFVKKIRQASLHLPTGLIGEDSLIGALAYWNLDPKQPWDRKYIITCKNANYTYKPLSIFSFSDLRLYYHRKIRYSLRHFQNQLMKAPLKKNGLQGLNSNVEEMYSLYSKNISLRWRGTDTWFDWLALRKIKANKMKSNEA
jgi:glycosyltransferase involved in cell wall biosynthesis